MLRRFVLQTTGFLALAGLLAGCRTANDGAVEALAAEEEPVLLCGDNGQLITELYGGIEKVLDWDNNELECTGMPRPEGAGIRLRFAGPTDSDEQRLAFIIALPDFARDTLETEFNGNITVIEEGTGRFFSTPDLSNCLVEIAVVEALDESGDRYAVTGAFYCVAPLPEINGKTGVSIPELRFTGLLDWSAS
jgi:hypothetical protein